MALKVAGKNKNKAVPKKPDMKKLQAEQAAKSKKTSKASKGDSKGEAAVDKGELILADKATLEVLPVLSEDEKRAKAVEDDKRFRELESGTRRSFVEMMFILRDMKAYDLHLYLTNKQGKKFGSFDSWLKEAAPLSRASGYSALKAADKLIPIIPRKELEEMPRYSLDLLTRIPKLKLDSVIIRTAAKTQSKKELVKTINEHAPEAHIEQKKKIVIDASLDSVIADAMQAAQDLGQVNESEAIEFICTSFMDSPCELEQYQGMSNRQAWNAHKMANQASGTAKELDLEPVSEGESNEGQNEPVTFEGDEGGEEPEAA